MAQMLEHETSGPGDPSATTRPGTDATGFGNVNLILADPDDRTRNEIKGVLRDQGFREIIDTDRMSVVAEAVLDGALDLLICGPEFDDGDVCQLISKIRHHEIGDNPFIVVITLIASPTREMVAKVIDSGIDDLMAKPISGKQVLARILHLSREHRQFVVTTDYIGPDRRKSYRPGTQRIPHIDVPNPVGSKAWGEHDPDKLRREIEEVAEILNEQKLKRHSYQIGFLVDRIAKAYLYGTNGKHVAQDLDRLTFVSEDITRRVEETRYAPMGDVCLSMVRVLDDVRAAPQSFGRAHIRDLQNLAETMKRAVKPHE